MTTGRPTADQLKAMAKTGVAMPDHSFYIRNAADLHNAVLAVGRATPNASESETARRNSVRRHIMKRARALNRTDMIPDSWNSDGSLKHSEVDEFLMHFGRKGMKWGVHVFGKDRGVSSTRHPVSADAAKAAQLKSTVRTHGTSALSNQDLQHLVTRLNLEQQHGRLNPAHVSAGRKVTNSVLKTGGEVAKQQASAFAVKYAAKGAEHLVKTYLKK